MEDVVIRPLRQDEADDAWDVGHAALREASERFGWEPMPTGDVVRERGLGRMRHVLEHDPDGAWVAECDGAIVGVSLATRRGPFWFLSLLAVSSEAQAGGIGKRLLDAALSTFSGAGAICASDDPKAVRRYRLAGFAMTPCYATHGALDRSLLPRIEGVRCGDAGDREFVESVATPLRGGPLGPDLDRYLATDARLYLADSTAGRGYAFGNEAGLVAMGATNETVAQSLLWTALAESTADEVRLMWITPANLWALDVALAARLPVTPQGSWATRGAVGPFAPYIPNGAFG